MTHSVPAIPAEADALLRRRHWREWRERLEACDWRSTPGGPRRKAADLTPAFAAFAAATKLAGLHAMGRRNALTVQRREMDLTFPDLPPGLDGYRILHLTDLHLDLAPGLATGIAAAVAGLSVDLCVMTGDYRAADDGPCPPTLTADMERVLSGITAVDGIFATLGNHDGFNMVAPLEELGIAVLGNDHLAVTRRGSRLSLVGLDDVSRYYTPLADAALDHAAPRDPQTFGLALVHSPEMADAAARHGYGLYLCGHTHCGQISLPGGRPIITRLASHRHLAAGLWRHRQMTGYTSPGAGVSSLPLRYFTRSEVTVITLRRANQASFPSAGHRAKAKAQTPMTYSTGTRNSSAHHCG